MNLKEYVLIFLVVFGVYISNAYDDFVTDSDNKTYRNLATSGDIVPNTFLSYVLINHQVLYFDKIKGTLKEFQSIKDRTPYFLIKTGDHYYSVYPPLTGLMAIPFFAIPLLFKFIPALNLWDYVLKILVIGRVSASFYAALSSILVYASLTKLSERKNLAALFTFFYAFGTGTWSIASRSLWQHTSSEFFISLLILILLYSKDRPKLIPWMGFISSLAILARPTNIIFIAPLALFVFFKERKYALPFCLSFLPAALFTLIYNHFAFGSALSEGYSARNDVKWSTPLLTGVTGFLISPSRSFLFVSPPLVLSYLALYKIFRTKNFIENHNLLFKFLSAGFLFSLLVFSKWYDWSGANGFGYRMLVDYLPFLIFITFLLLKNIGKRGLTALIIFMLYSVFIQYNAVFNLRSRCSERQNWNINCLITPKTKRFLEANKSYSFLLKDWTKPF